MFKLILFIVVGYVFYRFYISPIKRSLDNKKAKVNQNANNTKEKDDDDDSEYIDYEEIK